MEYWSNGAAFVELHRTHTGLKALIRSQAEWNRRILASVLPIIR
jgi:hypothetical protein